MSTWNTVLCESPQGVFAAAQLALQGDDVRLLCSAWDPYEYSVQGPELELFRVHAKEIALLEPVLGPLVPAAHCDIYVEQHQGKRNDGKEYWVPALSLKDRLDLQLGVILNASGDVCVDVSVEELEVDSGRAAACLLDTGRHHVGSMLHIDASPRRVRRWLQSVDEVPVDGLLEFVEIHLSYPCDKYVLGAAEQVLDVDHEFVRPGLWPGMAQWIGYQTCIVRCPRRHRFALLSPDELYGELLGDLNTAELTESSKIHVRYHEYYEASSVAVLSAYTEQLHAIGIRAVSKQGRLSTASV